MSQFLEKKFLGFSRYRKCAVGQFLAVPRKLPRSSQVPAMLQRSRSSRWKNCSGPVSYKPARLRESTLIGVQEHLPLGSFFRTRRPPLRSPSPRKMKGDTLAYKGRCAPWGIVPCNLATFARLLRKNERQPFLVGPILFTQHRPFFLQNRSGQMRERHPGSRGRDRPGPAR